MASKSSTATASEPKPVVKKQPASQLKSLEVLEGKWDTETVFKNNPKDAGMGSVSYSWLDGNYYLIGHFENAFTKGNIHKGIWVLGYDEKDQSTRGHFFDSMGNERNYEIGIEGRDYHIKGEFERYRGRIEGDTITGTWEKSGDGENWEYLCDEKMTRVVERVEHS